MKAACGSLPRCLTAALLSAGMLLTSPAAHAARFTVDMNAVMEVLPHALEAMAISERAAEREARHFAELAKRGVTEEPPDASVRYTVDAGAAGKFAFDNFGEFYIDRRFVTDSEMDTIHRIEAWFRKHFPGKKPGKSPRAPVPSRKHRKMEVPIFRGFESPRYQKHDSLIAAMVNEFNGAKAEWCGGSPAQAARIPDITAALVKSHMIEESGGNGPRSREAWEVDPLQVNVPGDWGAEKELVGLCKPSRRNEGTVEKNIRSAIMYLARKGFSSSARPAGERPKGYFDGWKQALRRYNGRRDRTDTDRCYNEEYADKILRRAANPDRFVPIEIKLAAKRKRPPEKTVDDGDGWWKLW